MENIKVTVLQDKELNLEKKRWLYYFTLPLMWVLAFYVAIKKKFFKSNSEINTFWFDGLSSSCRKIKEGAKGWQALDIIYNYEFNKAYNFRKFISNFWIGMMNAQAVRNRLKLVNYLLKESIKKFSKEKEIRLLSIASGSAQGVIGVISDLKKENILVKAVLLDLDPTAIEYAKKLAREYEVENQITFLNKSTRILQEVLNDFCPHVVEMIGFLEYRPRKQAIELISKIHRFLMPGGMFLTASISNNLERPFLYYVINWSMIYRTPEELSEVLFKSGFIASNCRIIYESHKIHNIVICQKSID
ncbi:class I SAM-dependent methyltransferase family protein [Candidatus Parcubacteria bacterium]|nr:class I SAM-dependent methyltransferase family protein [Candidatus Parcubacteria bacterium]